MEGDWSTIKVEEGEWKGWMRRGCGIQFGKQVYFYYPEFITVETKEQIRKEDLPTTKESES